MCIHILGKGNRKTANIGDVIVGSVKRTIPNAAIKPGELVKGGVARSRHGVRREDGTYVRFDRNAIVLIDAENNPRGTRIFGAVARELRTKQFTRILSLATEVV